MHLSLSITTFFLILPFIVKAENDWTTACAGSCAYETGDGESTAWGTILIDGAPEAISDISTAAGWSIMDCDPTSQDPQVIRLVCHDPDGECDSLFQGGAEDTIVRLPEDCASAPFARVVNVTTSNNQTLIPSVAKRVARKRKRGDEPQVMTVNIDYNFSLIPESRGTISLTALATTNPLQRPMATIQQVRRALGYGDNGPLNARSGSSPGELVAREARKRDLFADFISGNYIPSGTRDTPANATAKVADSGLNTRGIGHWGKDWNKQFNILDIDESFPVVDFDLQCAQSGDIPAFDAKLKIDADVDVQATVTVGFVIAGTILPPAITKAAFTSALDGSAHVDIKVSAVAHGSFSTGLLPLYSSGLAGLSIPGILDVGPIFSINGMATGSLGVATDAVVSANYQFPGISMVYPQDEGPSNGQASQGDPQTPLSLSIGGSASLTGSVSAHIIPRAELGVSVLSGMASASVFLQLDGYGSLDMNLSIEGATTVAVGPSSAISSIVAAEVTPSSVSANTTETASSAPPSTSTTTESPSTSTEASPDVAPSPSPDSTDAPVPSPQEGKIAPIPDESPASEPTLVSAENELTVLPEDETPNSSSSVEPSSPSCPTSRRRQRQKQRRDVISHVNRDNGPVYSGCVGMQMGVKIAAGAQGKLLSFWHDSTTFDIWSHEWSLLNKCFKSGTKRALPPFRHGPVIPSTLSPSLHHRDLADTLICPIIDHGITDALNADNSIV